MADTNGKTILTVDRATDVLSLFSRVDGVTLGVTEIARHLELSKAVVHRILSTLVEKQYVHLDEQTRRYSLGPQVLRLGLTYLDRIDIRGLARPVMERLVRLTGETSTLSISSGSSRIYIDQVTPANDVRMTVKLGQPYPLHAGSSSRALLAFLPEEEQEAYLSNHPLRAMTDATLVDETKLRAVLRKTRERGFASSMGERQAGAASVAAPVLDHRGRPVAALSVCGPAERFADSMEDAAQALLEGTAELSAAMGYRQPQTA